MFVLYCKDFDTNFIKIIAVSKNRSILDAKLNEVYAKVAHNKKLIEGHERSTTNYYNKLKQEIVDFLNRNLDAIREMDKPHDELYREDFHTNNYFQTMGIINDVAVEYKLPEHVILAKKKKYIENIANNRWFDFYCDSKNDISKYLDLSKLNEPLFKISLDRKPPSFPDLIFDYLNGEYVIEEVVEKKEKGFK